MDLSYPAKSLQPSSIGYDHPSVIHELFLPASMCCDWSGSWAWSLSRWSSNLEFRLHFLHMCRIDVQGVLFCMWTSLQPSWFSHFDCPPGSMLDWNEFFPCSSFWMIPCIAVEAGSRSAVLQETFVIFQRPHCRGPPQGDLTVVESWLRSSRAIWLAVSARTTVLSRSAAAPNLLSYWSLKIWLQVFITARSAVVFQSSP